jgi:hypothetical protein
MDACPLSECGMVAVDGNRMVHRRLDTGVGRGMWWLGGGDRWIKLYVPLVDASGIDKASRRAVLSVVGGDEAVLGVEEVAGSGGKERRDVEDISLEERVDVVRWGGASKGKNVLIKKNM